MKILLYGINFAPELTGIGKYTSEMAAWLAAAGHEVRVITAPPYYPAWQVAPGYHATRYTYEQWENVRVWRVPLWVPAQPSGLKRLLHLTSFAFCSWPLMVRQMVWRPDLVWMVEPTLFCAPAVLCVARLTGARAWLHVQDYEVDAAFALGLLKGERVRQLVSRTERWLMRRFDRVSTISDSMIERALGKGIDSKRLAYFPNWTDLDTIHPLTTPSSYRDALAIPANAVVALYSGNMGSKQGLEIMAEAAILLAGETNLYFVFCGNGPGKAELMRLTHGLANVQFLALQPLACLNDLLGLADIHLLPQRADAADLVMPSKLTGMLASGRAVVATATADTELGKIVRLCGLIVPPGDAKAFAAAITTLAHNPTQREIAGLAGRHYAECHLDKTGILRRFEGIISNMCNPQQQDTRPETAS